MEKEYEGHIQEAVEALKQASDYIKNEDAVSRLYTAVQEVNKRIGAIMESIRAKEREVENGASVPVESGKV